MRLNIPKIAGVWLLGLATLCGTTEAAPENSRVRSLKITILSTMLADGAELGEWGFSALVEADGHRLLFDTGAHSDVVLKNCRSLGIDLTHIPEVVLSHSHSDHVGGLITLRRSVLEEKAMNALSRVHVGEGIFYSRLGAAPPLEANAMVPIKSQYEETGGAFVIHDKPVQPYPGIWLTGPVPRKFPEHNWSGGDQVRTPAGIVEDNLPEDMALVFDTDQGLVVLTGCGHAGVVNILDYARTFVRPVRVHALIGGVHLFSATDKTLEWTAEKLREFGVENFIGAHCTGIETVYRFRRDVGWDREHAVVGAVGAEFELGKGINPRHIAR